MGIKLSLIGISLLISLWGCHVELGDEDIPEGIILIHDFPTKLYFLTTPKGFAPGCWMPEAGINTMANYAHYCGEGSTDSLYNFLGLPLLEWSTDIEIKILNFPDEAQLWNLQNLYTGNSCTKWEGEVDVVLSGIIYANKHNNQMIAHSLELTSLRKIKIREK
jgi:hypothetical protein